MQDGVVVGPAAFPPRSLHMCGVGGVLAGEGLGEGVCDCCCVGGEGIVGRRLLGVSAHLVQAAEGQEFTLMLQRSGPCVVGDVEGGVSVAEGGTGLAERRVECC